MLSFSINTQPIICQTIISISIFGFISLQPKNYSKNKKRMAEGVLFNIAEGILKNLGSKALEETKAVWGFKDRLNRLKDTVTTIKDVLLDAQDRQMENPTVRGWLLRLQAAVYAADDLFDEVVTVASQNKAMEGNKLTKEVRIFFSRFNHIALSFTLSQKIKSIREDLDAIVKDGHDFAFVLRPSEERGGVITRQHRGQTHSFIDTQDVIGRDEDKEAILDRLLDSSSSGEDVSIVPIVGMGGLGKTALAQLIYNDKMVEQHFELRLWVCVSEDFDEMEIVRKILMSATKAEPQKLNMDQLLSQLREAIGRRKYLLVLDDVWNEDREKWLKLSAIFKASKEGSKILVTTRLGRVAKIMGTVPPHHLGGLSEEKSWALFQKVALKPGQEHSSPQLVKVGKEIVERCGGVPLAIRTVGSLLHGENESKWLSVKDSDSLAKISDNGNNIMHILKLSYNHLSSPLKNCFAYCALFPKDYEFQKETLISLWMAEGFLIPRDGRQSQLEDVGEDYFLTLVQRCFFQDIEENDWGEIESCKIHDLLHDLAQDVAGVESIMARLEDTKLEKNIRRLSLGYRLSSTQSLPSCVMDQKLLRALLLPEQVQDGSVFSKSICHQMISSFRCLRVLDLNNLGVEILPSSIGKLMHLRYLNMSNTRIKILPSSVTDLHNLQILNLNSCENLVSLPKDIRKLTNLRSLDVGQCDSLSHMPPGMAQLSYLHKLNQFVVDSKYASDSRSSIGQLRDLKNLNSLKGELSIVLQGKLKDPAFEAKEASLSSKHGLNELNIIKRIKDGCDPSDVRLIEHDEAILEGLKPNHKLKLLQIGCYVSQKLPSWALRDNFSNCLPYLVEIKLFTLPNLQQLPSFGLLKFLKCLELWGLNCVEFMESSPFPHDIEGPPLFFPALERLALMNMHDLKGWWKHGEEGVLDEEEYGHGAVHEPPSWMSFANLSGLVIMGCPNLKSIPVCPNVEELALMNVDETLSVLKMAARPNSGFSKLKEMVIENVQDLIALPKECVQQLSYLNFFESNLHSTRLLQQVFTSLPCLRVLIFTQCESLKCGAASLQHLTALEELSFRWCSELDLSANSHQGTENEDEDEDGMPWKSLNKSLRSLELIELDKLEALPDGFQYLTNLHSLKIKSCNNLEELPEWIDCLSSLEVFKIKDCPELTSLPEGFSRLTSLNTLKIRDCPGLTKRCQAPTGADWPKIQHIPLVINLTK